MKKIGLILVFFLVYSSIWANDLDSIRTKIGLFGGYNYNIHSASFSKLRDVDHCCKLYEDGIGSGLNFGALFEYRLNNNFWIGGRIGFMVLDGLLKSEEEITVSKEENGKYTTETGLFEHRMNGGFTNLAIEPMAIYSPYNNFFFSLGLRAGTFISATYDQKEQLVEPTKWGTFENNQRVRNEYSGDISDVDDLSGFQLHAMLMLSYELPMNKKQNLFLVPEVSYYLPLTENIANSEWKVNTIRGGVAVKYAFIPEKEIPVIYEKEFEIDTIEIESDIIAQTRFVEGQIIKDSTELWSNVGEIKTVTQFYKRIDTIYTPKNYQLEADITAAGYNENTGEEIENPTYVIEEFVSNRHDPLLNYIFFDENSAVIPSRYKLISSADTDNFTINQLYESSTLNVYHNVLNIIGLRMQKLSSATLTITGCNSDYGKEKGNLELSESRALAVKNYLSEVWGINENRLRVKKRNLSVKPSTPLNEKLKIAENCRVELTSNNDELLAPIFIEKIDRTANPPSAKFYLSAISEAGIKSWKIEIKYNNGTNPLFLEEGHGKLPEYVIWTLENDQSNIPNKEMPLEYTLFITDNKNNSQQSKVKNLNIKIETVREKRNKNIDDKEIETFSLILFDFDKAEISNRNAEIIKMIKSKIKEDSKVQIVGYTDKTGNTEHNLKLSEQRAKSAYMELGFKDAITKGIEEDERLFDGSTPESRFYSRTVVITVTTPIR
jgi:outer membrane protein OmpA-like peptidoglycan-associated protein